MKTARIKSCLVAILALSAFLVSLPNASGQQSGSSKDTVIPAIQMQNVPLATAIENLGRQAGLNYILDPKLAGPTIGPDGKYVPPPSVSIRWENISAQQALTRLLGEHGLCAVESPVSSVTRITFTNQVVNPVDKAWVAGGTNSAVPLMQMQNAPLDRALANLATQAQLDVVLDTKLSNPSFVPGKPFVPTPTVSFRWENLTARQAIAALCENYNLVLVEDAGAGRVRIAPK